MKKKVLIVDDDFDFLEQLEIMLSVDFNVTKAGGQIEAEELLKTEMPDIAVIDLMMENTDGGFALSYHIKKLNPSVPVIIITSVSSETGINFADASEEEKSWIKADAFLAKPIRYEQLKKEIDRLMNE
jgi:DNA-binding NtrC family response regulator